MMHLPEHNEIVTQLPMDCTSASTLILGMARRVLENCVPFCFCHVTICDASPSSASTATTSTLTVFQLRITIDTNTFPRPAATSLKNSETIVDSCEVIRSSVEQAIDRMMEILTDNINWSADYRLIVQANLEEN